MYKCGSEVDHVCAFGIVIDVAALHTPLAVFTVFPVASMTVYVTVDDKAGEEEEAHIGVTTTTEVEP